MSFDGPFFFTFLQKQKDKSEEVVFPATNDTATLRLIGSESAAYTNFKEVFLTRNGKRVQFVDADDLTKKFKTRNRQMKYSLSVLDPINQSMAGANALIH